MASEIRVVCRKCGKTGAADSFILDHEYKMMVCPACVKEKQIRKDVARELEKEKKAKEEEENKPAGWDIEDEYLERTYKQTEKISVEKIDNERVRYACPKCKYKFVYNTATKRPALCPYCGVVVDSKFINM